MSFVSVSGRVRRLNALEWKGGYGVGQERLQIGQLDGLDEIVVELEIPEGAG